MTDVERSYRARYAPIALLALGMFTAATNSFVIAGLLPAIAADFGVTPATVSLSITAYALAVAVGAPVVSITLARVPRVALMAAGLIVFAAGGALAAGTTVLPLFVLGRTLSGVGAAALVPTGTAVAATLVPAEQRGRALALVTGGFTLATAVGAPLGTTLGASYGWRAPLWGVAGLGVLLAVVLPLVVRDVPAATVVGLRARLVPLRRWSVITPLVATLLVIAAFNLVYIFSALVVAGATGGSAHRLALLLLCYGVAGIVGNAVAGPVTDRIGSRTTATIALVGHGVALLVILAAQRSLPGEVIAFVLWGVAAFAAAVPLQHRLVTVAPEAAQITLAWYSTAMYLGIALAPLVAAAVLAGGGPAALPVVGAIATFAALAIFLAGARRQPSAPSGLGWRPSDSPVASPAPSERSR